MNHYCTECKQECEIEFESEEGSNGPDGLGGYQIFEAGSYFSACCQAEVVHDENKPCDCEPPEHDYEPSLYDPETGRDL